MSEPMVFARRFRVSGRVQGVFYRASTREVAVRLGVRGYAKNLADGQVEVLAIGAVESLGQLEQWLWRGPMAAQVNDVQATEVALATLDDRHADFVTL